MFVFMLDVLHLMVPHVPHTWLWTLWLELNQCSKWSLTTPILIRLIQIKSIF